MASLEEPPPTSLSAEPTSTAMTCGYCGAIPLFGPFCHACGQRSEGRLSFRSVAQGLRDQVAQLDFALLRTLLQLSVHPGRTARAYLSGRRRQYTNPVTYAFLTSTVYALLMGFVELQPLGVAGQYSALVNATGPAIPYVLLLALFPVAALQRWVFGREGLTTAECYVFLLFVWSQLFVLSALIILSGTYDTTLGLAAAGLLAVGFHCWAFLEFHDVGLSVAVVASLTAFVLTEVLGLSMAVLGRSIWIALASGGDGV